MDLTWTAELHARATEMADWVSAGKDLTTRVWADAYTDLLKQGLAEIERLRRELARGVLR